MTRSRKSRRTGTRVQGIRDAVQRHAKNKVFWLFLVCLTAAGVVLFARAVPNQRSQTHEDLARILFVGDIMLARNVETLMNMHGLYYPFKGLRDMLVDYDVAVGNFEASIPERHTRTPSFNFRFSAIPDVAEALSRVGFTDMTLANNHSYDYGKEGYVHTREVLTDAGLGVGGNPQAFSADEILYRTVGDVRVAIIPINTIHETPELEAIEAAFAIATEKSDLQIISIHWGAEYELVSNDTQRALARALVDSGADAIIGHHPHVVQEIEEYRGAPIFYSLGNCIFDQYWNTDVQEGLTVAISFEERGVTYKLIPITSVDTQSAPRPMNRIERVQFLDTLAKRSEQSLSDAIKEGIITELFASSLRSRESK